MLKLYKESVNVQKFQMKTVNVKSVFIEQADCEEATVWKCTMEKLFWKRRENFQKNRSSRAHIREFWGFRLQLF